MVVLAAVAGAAAIVTGVAGLAGPWWALIAGGTFVLVGAGALLYDPETRHVAPGLDGSGRPQ